MRTIKETGHSCYYLSDIKDEMPVHQYKEFHKWWSKCTCVLVKGRLACQKVDYDRFITLWDRAHVKEVLID